MASRPGSLLLSRAPVTSTADKPNGVGGAAPQRPVMSWMPPGTAAATAAAVASAAAAKGAAVQGTAAIPRLAFSAGTGAANPGINSGSGAATVRYASPHANLSSVSSAPTVGKGGGFRWQQTDEKKLIRDLPDRNGTASGSAVAPSSMAASGSVTASGTFPVGAGASTGTAASRSVAVPIVPSLRVVAGGARGRGASMTPREGRRPRASSPPPPSSHAHSTEPAQLLSPAVPLSNSAGPVGMSQVHVANASHRARCMVVEPQQLVDGASNTQGSAQRRMSPARGPTGTPATTPAPMPPTASAVTSLPAEPPGWIKPPGGWIHAHVAVATIQSPRQRSLSPSIDRHSGAVGGATGGRGPPRNAEASAAAQNGSLSVPASSSVVGVNGDRAISMAWSGTPRSASPPPPFTSSGSTALPISGSASTHAEAPPTGSCEVPATSQLPTRGATSPPASFAVPVGRVLPSSFSPSVAGSPQAPASFAAISSAVPITSEKAARSYSSTALPVKRSASTQAWTDMAPPGGSVAAPPATTLPAGLQAGMLAGTCATMPSGAPICPPPGGSCAAPPGDPLQAPYAMPSFASRLHRSVSSQTAQDLALRNATSVVSHRLPSSRGTSRASTPPGQQRVSMFTSVPTQMSVEASPSPKICSLRRQGSLPDEGYRRQQSYGSEAVPELACANFNGGYFDGNRDHDAADLALDEPYYNGVCSAPNLQPRHMSFDGIGDAGSQQSPYDARSSRIGISSMQNPMLSQVRPPQAVSGSGATSSRHTLPAGSSGSAVVRGSGSSTSLSREDSRGGTPLRSRNAAPLARQLGVSPRPRDRRPTGSPQERSESAPRVTHTPVDRAQSTNDQPMRRQASPRSSQLKGQQEPTLQLRLSMAMMAEEHGMAPGAADKWKVLQLFHESLPRGLARVERIDRLTGPQDYRSFLDVVGEEECEVGFYAPAGPSQLARLRESGFCIDDFEEVPGLGFGVPVASHAGAAHQRARGPRNLLEGDASGGERCLCVLLCAPLLFSRSASTGACSNNGVTTRNWSDQPVNWKEYCILDPNLILISYTVWYQQVPEDRAAPGPRDGAVTPPMPESDRRNSTITERRRKQLRQHREYAKVRDPLIKVALQGLERVADGTMSTVLLPTTSVEAESVVSLYLLGGGGSRVNRPPGVDPREALGGVVVQRIENQPLFREYTGLGQAADGAISESQSPAGENGSSQPRYREDVVWHGTRLKKADGEGASLATKLQSIAEKGFDPQRCMKGAAAEGGIWVATTPLASFGHGCDGLVAFVLCLSKTHFNEWVDATCARVLQRERVLPLYSLVHA